MAYRSVGAMLVAGIGTIVMTGHIAAAPVAMPYNWSGFYIGENGGYGWGAVNASESPGDAAAANGVNPVTASSTKKGAAGGITEGFNWQLNGKWVTGLEADFQLSDIAGSGNAAVSNIVGLPFNYGVLGASQKTEWFGTVRPVSATCRRMI